MVLRCKADKLIYEDLAWFRVANVTEAEQLSSVQPCRSLVLQETPLSQRLHSNPESANVTLELPMPNASREDEGLYACQVKNIKTQEKTCLLRRLSLKSKKNLSCYLMDAAALSELNQFSWAQKSRNRSKASRSGGLNDAGQHCSVLFGSFPSVSLRRSAQTLLTLGDRITSAHPGSACLHNTIVQRILQYFCSTNQILNPLRFSGDLIETI